MTPRYKERRAAKHRAQRMDTGITEGTFKTEAAFDTPDALGLWEGGTAALKGVANWVALKSRPTRTADNKNAHGTNNHLGPKPLTHRQDADFCEIHTDANGDFWLYNVKNDKWDIPTDAQTVPFYEDENGKTWDYNYKTGAWDVPVVPEDQDAPGEYPVNAMKVLEGMENTKRSEAFVPEEKL